MRRALVVAVLTLAACSNASAPDGSSGDGGASGNGAVVSSPSISPAPPGFSPRAQRPVLSAPSTLDFGKARTGSKTLPLPVRNDGGATLTFQISSDRGYVTMRGARGSVPPGATAIVDVTYNYDEAYDGARDVPLPVRSNGGDAVVRVLGLTDSIGPKADSDGMKTVHEHCAEGSCATYRHARATITDASSGVVSAKLHFRTCRGAGVTPVCDDWRLVGMRRVAGTTWEGDAGPLPACASGVRVVVHFRIIARDDLENESYSPGNSTWYFGPHCPG